MRIRCTLFGCREHDMASYCVRCGEWLYDDFIHDGKLSPVITRLQRAWRWLRTIFKPDHCEICGCRIKHGTFGVCEKEECREKWIPF